MTESDKLNQIEEHLQFIVDNEDRKFPMGDEEAKISSAGHARVALTKIREYRKQHNI